MVFRLALLILAALLAGSPAAGAASSRCLDCHPVHYATRGDCASCHRGDPRSNRAEIAHHGFIPAAYARFSVPGSPVTTAGRRLLDQLACRRCHVIGGEGNRLAGPLDPQLATADPLELREAILRPVLFMPDFRLTDPQLVELVNALLSYRAGPDEEMQEVPLVVHFEPENGRENPFDKHCGACHRVLTAKHGGLGGGAIGPNLSGLLSPFYPPNFKDQQPWTAEHLKSWLDNPRKIRPVARMRPVRLQDEEFRALRELLWEPERVVMSAEE